MPPDDNLYNSFFIQTPEEIREREDRRRADEERRRAEERLYEMELINLRQMNYPDYREHQMRLELEMRRYQQERERILMDGPSSSFDFGVPTTDRRYYGNYNRPRNPIEERLREIGHHSETCPEFNGFVVQRWSNSDRTGVKRITCSCGWEMELGLQDIDYYDREYQRGQRDKRDFHELIEDINARAKSMREATIKRLEKEVKTQLEEQKIDDPTYGLEL